MFESRSENETNSHSDEQREPLIPAVQIGRRHTIITDPRILVRTLRQRPDTVALIALISLLFGVVAFRWFYDNWLAELDTFTVFLPPFSYIGARLSDFEIPAWNPYSSGGAPMAGDSQGGWMYLPMMFAFSLFNPSNAMKVMVLIQTLVGGISAYWLARRIGLTVIPSFACGLGFGIGPMLYAVTISVTVSAQLNAFLPLVLLGVESALRATRISARAGWSALAGVGFAHMFNAWPGQGVMYATAIVGGWMGWRLLIERVPEVGSIREHANRLIVSGVVMVVTTIGFGAAGILPRLDFNAQSNVPGGDYSEVVGGNYRDFSWTFSRTLLALIQDEFAQRPFTFGITILILAIVAITRFRQAHGVYFWTLATVVLFELATAGSIFRTLLGVIPGFEHLHGHAPTRAIWLLPLPVTILAAIGMQFLLDRNPPRWNLAWRLFPIIAIGATAWCMDRANYSIGVMPYVIGLLTVLVIVIPALPLISIPIDRSSAQFATGLLVLIVAYPTLTDFARTIESPESGVDADGRHFSRPLGTDVGTRNKIERVLGIQEPDGAAAFMLSDQITDEPFRYVVYGGYGYDGNFTPYIVRRMSLELIAAMTNNRSMYLGIEDVSGYNPLHLKYYSEYINAINGEELDYHYTDVLGAKIGNSQLLDMLNPRYVVVTRDIPAEREDVAQIYATMREVYRDNRVVVFENPDAFERAWVVHQVLPDQGTDALEAFGNGSVDGRTTAFVFGDVPVSTGDGSVVDQVEYVDWAPESATFDVTSNGDGLMVVSEPYEDNWNAYVDGEKVDILRTNHALRGIPVPAGTHRVEMKYEPRELQIGLWTTGASSVAIMGVWIWAFVDRRRYGAEHGTETTN